MYADDDLDGGANDDASHAMGMDASTQKDVNIFPALDASDDTSSSSDASQSQDSGQKLLGPPCSHGKGFVAWKFHYANNSTSAITDVYSLPDNSNWQAVPAYSTSFVDSLHGGGIQISGGNWILIRFSVQGMKTINGATLSVFGRSYDTTTSGSFNAWSPIYGSVYSPQNSHSNAWPYQWVTVDYSSNVKIGDSPGLTGIRLYSGPNSNVLVINTVELCIDGS